MKISALAFSALCYFTCLFSTLSMAALSGFPPRLSVSDSIPGIAQNEDHPPLHFVLRYNLEMPDTTFEMPEILEEISGLGFDKNFEKLYAIQDEDGIIFIIDKKTGVVEKKITFHKEGDYEGIEVIGDVVYVVKSTGTIYEVTNLGTEEQETKKYNLFLQSENDVEGLGFDPQTNKLLMACKGIPATGESFDIIRHKKVVYGFDINTKEIDPEPLYNIRLDAILKCLHNSSSIKNTENLTSQFSSEKEEIDFNPSGIAIHPFSKDIYILSSAGKTLIVLNYAGQIIHIEKLQKEIHRQPEGIAFDADGTLYISNEGKGKDQPGNIYRFNYAAD